MNAYSLVGACDVPEGQSGLWRVEKFTITDQDARFARLNPRMRLLKPGDYTRLMRGLTVVMSDTYAEIGDMHTFSQQRGGRWLIAGLGLGMAVRRAFDCQDAESVVVIEKSPDVLMLSRDHYTKKYGDRLKIILGDIFDVKPAEYGHFDFAWFDIWDYICTDNIAEMSKLHRRWGKHATYKHSWCHSECLRSRASGY